MSKTKPKVTTDYHTIAEVAAQLRLTYDTVWKMVNDGTIGSYEMGPNGGSIRISQEQLDVYLNSVRNRKSRATKKGK